MGALKHVQITVRERATACMYLRRINDQQGCARTVGGSCILAKLEAVSGVSEMEKQFLLQHIGWDVQQARGATVTEMQWMLSSKQ